MLCLGVYLPKVPTKVPPIVCHHRGLCLRSWQGLLHSKLEAKGTVVLYSLVLVREEKEISFPLLRSPPHTFISSHCCLPLPSSAINFATRTRSRISIATEPLNCLGSPLCLRIHSSSYITTPFIHLSVCWTDWTSLALNCS